MFETILSWIVDKKIKWALFGLLFVCITALLSWSVPVAYTKSIESISMQAVSNKLDSIESKLDKTLGSVESIDKTQTITLVNNARAAFRGKFDGLSGGDLINAMQNSTQNGQAVLNALSVDKSRDILRQSTEYSAQIGTIIDFYNLE